MLLEVLKENPREFFPVDRRKQRGTTQWGQEGRASASEWHVVGEGQQQALRLMDKAVSGPWQEPQLLGSFTALSFLSFVVVCLCFLFPLVCRLKGRRISKGLSRLERRSYKVETLIAPPFETVLRPAPYASAVSLRLASAVKRFVTFRLWLVIAN
jgi:hypothetical protein